ncbi:hypothetical protein SAMD00019534_126690 [Acytostelium subglobosum LB1]|uniref:hypothetical protein n=1 Tax=Acytostelium subglobosum LB1 TaxID=1410327 RepID=UPI000644EEFE|nr:hypothetical protein SAMD00019534_126690 [Acytostelium subglobosum LB1]GAM29493.1 hypothetical protein SAMD00019534_126690 [Acytostelium subglobosum LB1]|eukprot:XP_012747559.1 hypothetical protein SAMD00019534_126690 [Acytostelium subglobosum LB1]
MEEFSDVIVDEITTGLPPARSTDLKLKLIDENKIMRGYPYRKSPKQQEAMDQITKRLYERGSIIPSTAAHGCTANVIWKKDGRPRLIIDFRPVNNNIVTATDNIPRTDDIINRFQSNKWFTDADMIDGYWQCRVSPESSKYLNFSDGRRMWSWVVLPQGLSSSPSVFNQAIAAILQEDNDNSQFNYFDNIIYLKKSKTHLFENKIEVLGYQVQCVA